MARVSAKSGVMVLLWVACLITLYSIYSGPTYSGVASVDSNVSAPVSIQRLNTKLEYLNGKLIERDYELHQMKEKVQQMERDGEGRATPSIFHNKTASTAIAPVFAAHRTLNSNQVPNLFQLMPHLNHNSSALKPHRTFGHCKHNMEMVLAVPHVHRDKVDYLLPTLVSLFRQMAPEEKEKTAVVVMVAEPFNISSFDTVTKMAFKEFPNEINSGNLEIILPPAMWYPDLDDLPDKWGDKPERAKWRTKQNLDYAFMMLYCSHLGDLYVQLEDDISAKPQYIKQMKQYATSQDRWELLEFSQLGFIGKMFKSAMLPKFVSFILMFYKHKPVDWLLDNYFWVQECHGKSCSDLSRIRKRFRPSLFQHEGYHSSLAGKVQKLKDKDFNKKGENSKDPMIFAHDNPPAVVETSLKAYQKFTVEKCYDGKSVFWALNPQPNDHITVRFKQAVVLKSYKVVSGDSQHKEDRLLNASIEFLPVSSSAPRPADSFLLDDSGFVGFKHFNTTARRAADDDVIYTIVEGTIPSGFGAVSAVRIMSHAESQNWMIISELWFVS